MARRCSICDDPRREDIDKALVSARLARHVIAEEFGVPKHRLDNHVSHIVQNVDLEEPKGQSIHDVAALWALAKKEYDASKDPKVRMLAIQRMQTLLELQARLQQEAHGVQSLSSQPAFQLIAAWLANHLCHSCLASLDAANENVIGTALSATQDTPGGGYPDETK